MKTKTLYLVLIILTLFAGAYGKTSNAQVYVIHGIPGQDLGLDPALPVDVAVEGDCLLNGFTYGQVVGPLDLPEGTYNIQISVADTENPCENPPVIDANVPFSAGEVAVVIAHLTEDQSPTASKFLINQKTSYGNELYDMKDEDEDEKQEDEKGHYRYGCCGRPSITLHHTAAAPTVDIELKRSIGDWAGGKQLTDVSNGDQAAVKLLPGNWDISLFPAGSNEAVLGPIDLKVKPRKSYYAFAVGSLDAGTLNLLIYQSDCRDSQLRLIPAVVYVIHGIPGEDLDADPDLPVDISLNGICALPEFTFSEITDPIPLTPGLYNVQIALANPANPCNEPAVIEANIPLYTGENLTIIAHLTEDGQPIASVFMNELNVRRGYFFRAPLVVHHTAAAPAVDVKAGKNRRRILKLENVINGDQGILNTTPGFWKISIAPAGSNNPVFGPVKLRLKNRNAYFVYAVGSLENETFTVLQNIIPLKDLPY